MLHVYAAATKDHWKGVDFCFVELFLLEVGHSCAVAHVHVDLIIEKIEELALFRLSTYYSIPLHISPCFFVDFFFDLHEPFLSLFQVIVRINHIRQISYVNCFIFLQLSHFLLLHDILDRRNSVNSMVFFQWFQLLERKYRKSINC